jgi:glutamyl-tRNA reductase
VAVDLAKGVLGDLGKCHILVIGAGEAGRLVAQAAMERGARSLSIFNRSREKAVTLAGSLGSERVVSDLDEALAEADVAISCTAAPHAVVKLPQMEEVMRRRPGRPLVVIDIAVPRDIDPEIKMLDDVVLYNIDDLTDICNMNRTRRERESLKAMKIIREEADRFLEWWQSLEMKPIVAALIQKAEDIRRAQLDLTMKKLPPLDEKQQQSLEAMTKAIVTKVLHDPIHYLKDDAQNKKEYSKMVSEIFRLDREKS